MNDDDMAFINTRLQPGGEGVRASEPFQRLAGAGKPLKRFGYPALAITGLKPAVNEMTLLIGARLNSLKSLSV